MLRSPMPQRAQWNGWLKLSLVSCPVSLFPAIATSERVSFRNINRQTGNRLRQQLVDEVSGDVVQPHEKARGYEVAERQYVVVEDSELDKAREEARTRPFGLTAPTATPDESTPRGAKPPLRNASTLGKREPVGPELAVPAPLPPRLATPRPVENNRTIMIDRFVPRSEVDTRYYDTPYYIAPRDDVGEEAFAVIRDAMAAKKVVGLARVVLARRERPILIDPFGKGLCGTTLRYAHEIRAAADYFADIADMELPDELIEVAERIIDAKKGTFDPALLEDRYRTVLVEALKAKTPKVQAKAGGSLPSTKKVIDLMAMLKRSVAEEKIAPKGPHMRTRSANNLDPTPRRAAAETRRAPTKRSKSIKKR
jgi:DNA end-binding protein Ku